MSDLLKKIGNYLTVIIIILIGWASIKRFIKIKKKKEESDEPLTVEQFKSEITKPESKVNKNLNANTPSSNYNFLLNRLFDKTWPITSYFGDDRSKHRTKAQIEKGNIYHQGIDIGAPSGTSIKAPYKAVVSSIHNSNKTQGGRSINLKFENGIVMYFAHLSEINVSVDQEVTAGTIIGKVGGSGNGKENYYGAHLHLQVYNTKGVLVNPLGLTPFDFGEVPKNLLGPIKPDFGDIELPSTESLSSLDKEGKMDYLYHELHSKFGFTVIQISGIIGNLYQESRLDETQVNKSSGATGIAQWYKDRKTKFKTKYGKALVNASFQEQVAYLILELKTSHKNTVTQLKKKTTVESATESFEATFEVSGGSAMSARKAYAREAFTYLSKYLNEVTESVTEKSSSDTITNNELPTNYAIHYFNKNLKYGAYVDPSGNVKFNFKLKN